MIRIFLLSIMALVGLNVFSQDTKTILDKAASLMGHPGGISANFRLSGTQQGNISGSIKIKGNKFEISTTFGKVWFDGKTQWTYVKDTEEVTVNTPSKEDLLAINPYNYINIYKSGVNYSHSTSKNSYTVKLTPKNAGSKTKEIILVIGRATYAPSQIKIKEGNTWTDITISNLKKNSFTDSVFRFNQKDYPQSEVIDLR